MRRIVNFQSSSVCDFAGFEKSLEFIFRIFEFHLFDMVSVGFVFVSIFGFVKKRRERRENKVKERFEL